MTEAQQKEKRTGMRDKPQSEMTRDEIRGFMKPLGIPSLPFPMADLKENSKGGYDWEVGMIHDFKDALYIPSEQSAERVYGRMLRACPTPQMMLAFRKLITRLQPESTNRLISIFGDRSSGKSHIIKEVGAVVHPEGCVVVDCGGMNMRELFWRTVIDYGQGVKEQLEKRVAEGKVLPSSLNMLDTEFPGSIVRKNGAVSINWDAVSARKAVKDGESGDIKANEDRGDAVRRAIDVLNFVYEKEGIAVKSNSFGIKTVPGELYECYVSGRPPFLDEFNKSQKGTLDAYQNFLEWLNGNDKNPVIRIPNPMATTEGDGVQYIEFDRRRMKLGWFVGVAGNDPKDGTTTQVLSESMEDRLSIIRIGDPSKLDWEHRYSQIVSGFPLKTWVDFFENDAKVNPEAFAKDLVARRLMGLTATERKLVPPNEIEALKSFQNTVVAVQQLAEGYYDQQQLSKPESPKASEEAFKKCQNELAMGRKNIKVSFRTAIQEHADALKMQPEIIKKGGFSLSYDLVDAFKSACAYGTSASAPAWHKLGANLVRVRQEAIANATVDMPLTAAALVRLWQSNGVFPAEMKEAKKSEKTKCIIDLLKYDDISSEGLGNSQDLEKQRDVLMAALRSINPDIDASPDRIIPLKNLALAMKALASADDTPVTMLLPNDDLDTVTANPVVHGEALPLYDLPESLEEEGYKLVDFRTALAAFTIPGFAEKNRDRIWPVDLLDRMPEEERPQGEALIRDIYDPLRGKSAHGFDLCILAAAGKEGGEAVYLYVIDDKERGKMLIAGPEKISAELQSALGKNGISYVLKDSVFTAKEIEEFMGAGHTERFNAGKIRQEDEARKLQANLIQAFSAICRHDDGGEDIEKGTGLGDYIQSGQTPNVFTTIVTKTKPAASL